MSLIVIVNLLEDTGPWLLSNLAGTSGGSSQHGVMEQDKHIIGCHVNIYRVVSIGLTLGVDVSNMSCMHA